MLDANNNSDIKALLILLLLKGGTQPEEIQTAMRMAATSRLIDSQRAALQPRDDRPVPVADCSCGATHIRPSTPKQVIRNDYLAPIKGHAA